MESLKQAKRVVTKAQKRFKKLGGTALYNASVKANDRVIAAENRNALQKVAKRDGNDMTPAQVGSFIESLG